MKFKYFLKKSFEFLKIAKIENRNKFNTCNIFKESKLTSFFIFDPFFRFLSLSPDDRLSWKRISFRPLFFIIYSSSTERNRRSNHLIRMRKNCTQYICKRFFLAVPELLLTYENKQNRCVYPQHFIYIKVDAIQFCGGDR